MQTLRKTGSMPGGEDAVIALMAQLEQGSKIAAETAGSARKRLNEAREARVLRARLATLYLVSGVGSVVAAPYAGLVLAAVGLRGDLSAPSTMATMLAYVLGSILVGLVVADLAVRTGDGDMTEENAAVAVAGARRSVEECRRVAAAVQKTADEHGVWNADCEMARHLANTVFTSAKANRGLENRVRGAAAARSRRDERIVPKNDRVVLTRSDGRTLFVKVVDVSVSGAAIVGNLPGVEVGSKVRLGRHAAVAIRATKGGFGLKFDKNLEPTQLHAGIVL